MPADVIERQRPRERTPLIGTAGRTTSSASTRCAAASAPRGMREVRDLLRCNHLHLRQSFKLHHIEALIKPDHVRLPARAHVELVRSVFTRSPRESTPSSIGSDGTRISSTSRILRCQRRETDSAVRLAARARCVYPRNESGEDERRDGGAVRILTISLL